MSARDKNQEAPVERMELRHEAKPGYKMVFLIVFTIGLLYLFAVFAFGIGATQGGFHG